MELVREAKTGGQGSLMARVTCVFTLEHVARMIGENQELLEVIAANSDNIDYGEMIDVVDGTETDIKAFTQRGIESLQELLEDIRSWPGGIRQFLITEQCEPELIEYIMADESGK